MTFNCKTISQLKNKVLFYSIFLFTMLVPFRGMATQFDYSVLDKLKLKSLIERVEADEVYMIDDKPFSFDLDRNLPDIRPIDISKLIKPLDGENRLFCENEVLLFNQRASLESHIGLIGVSDCLNKYHDMEASSRPEIVLGYEFHSGKSYQPVRQELLGTLRHDRLALIEGLNSNSSPAAFSRFIVNQGLPFSSLGQLDKYDRPRSLSKNLIGLDNERLRAMRSTFLLTEMLVDSYPDKKPVAGQLNHGIRALFLEEVIRNPYLQTKLDSIVTNNNSNNLKRPVDLYGNKLVDGFWMNEDNRGRWSEVIRMSLLFSDMAGATKNSEGGWKKEYVELKRLIGNTWGWKMDSYDDISLSWFLLSLIEEMKMEFPFPLQPAKDGFLYRDWAFANQITHSVCEAIDRGKTKVFVNLGIGHAERVNHLLRRDLGSDAKITYQNMHNSNSHMSAEEISELYNPKSHCQQNNNGSHPLKLEINGQKNAIE